MDNHKRRKKCQQSKIFSRQIKDELHGSEAGVTKQRHGTELIGEGYYVYCGGFKVKKGSCSGGRRRGGMRVLVGSQMMMGRGALGSKDL